MRKKPLFDLISPTSMGIRLTPINRQPVQTSDVFLMRASSAETNVLSISAGLGLNTKILTKFVENSPIANFIQADLRKRGITYEGLSVPQDGPWGYRHQFNIADSGYGSRGPRVLNDRAGEVGRTMKSSEYDLVQLFEKDGVGYVHLSGLIAALSEDTSQLCLEIARIAKKNGSIISFDLNYRASFWKGRTSSLRKVFSEIASLSDVLIGNEEDFQLCLNIEGPSAGGKSIENEIEQFKAMIMRVKLNYPNAKVFATTLREVINANEHLWGAIVLNEDHWSVIHPKPILVLDRIGGGDGFVGGLLYGLIKGFEKDQVAQFAWATGALATTVIEDYALPMDESQVWSIWEGNARVVR